MKRLKVWILALCASACAHAGTPQDAPDDALEALLEEFNARLDAFDARFANADRSTIVREINLMSGRDVRARDVLTELSQHAALNDETRTEFFERAFPRIEAMDAVHTARLKEILQTVSWSDLAEMSTRRDDPVHDAWYIVQHAPNDVAFQRAALADLEPLARDGRAPSDDYALLYDRVTLQLDGVQRYGSQVQCRDGEWVPFDLEDPENVDARRAELGMPPLERYMAIVAATFGPCTGP